MITNPWTLSGGIGYGIGTIARCAIKQANTWKLLVAAAQSIQVGNLKTDGIIAGARQTMNQLTSNRNTEADNQAVVEVYETIKSGISASDWYLRELDYIV